MTGLELAALIAVAAWLASLSVVAVLCVRQLGILSTGLRPASDGVELAGDGLAIGQRVPVSVRSLIPGLTELRYLLFVETGCAACRDLIAQFADSGIKAPLTVVMQGGATRASSLVALLPEETALVRDPDAAEVFELMEVGFTPAVLEVERGFVTGKGVLRGLHDLESLIRARAADGTKVADELAELNGLKVEVYDGGR
jgi:hypothetical protein